MKRRKELTVDFIGEQGVTLTDKEKESISSFIRNQKEKRDDKLKQKSATIS